MGRGRIVAHDHFATAAAYLWIEHTPSRATHGRLDGAPRGHSPRDRDVLLSAGAGGSRCHRGGNGNTPEQAPQALGVAMLQRCGWLARNIGQLQAGVQAAADARMRNYARYQAHSGSIGDPTLPAPRKRRLPHSPDESTLMQMFMAGGGTGPSLSTVALTQVTRSLDLNLCEGHSPCFIRYAGTTRLTSSETDSLQKLSPWRRSWP